MCAFQARPMLEIPTPPRMQLIFLGSPRNLTGLSDLRINRPCFVVIPLEFPIISIEKYTGLFPDIGNRISILSMTDTIHSIGLFDLLGKSRLFRLSGHPTIALSYPTIFWIALRRSDNPVSTVHTENIKSTPSSLVYSLGKQLSIFLCDF